MSGAEDAFHESVVGTGYSSGPGWVVVARGELDQDTLGPLEEALTTAADRHRLVVLDAGAITFGDSSFLNLLLRFHHVTALRIAAPGEQLRRLFALTGADTVLSLSPSVEHALGT
ncbi:STAS domain-containing protein [Streptomyces sp. NBC_01565]|uniref:STAS domain-containing protein n=1 Tax=unclassified Streptomyces TaxID=2593676 RepID=UPI00224C9677|nr:STAS domain-containing protein [Streptomyces sp. NBC_01565]MCX4545664.1 STAS domain-containing protein [Streptomyces sp. NBC_01565]